MTTGELINESMSHRMNKEQHSPRSVSKAEISMNRSESCDKIKKQRSLLKKHKNSVTSLQFISNV